MNHINYLVLENLRVNLQRLFKRECIMRGSKAVCKDLGREDKSDSILRRKGKIK